MLVCPWDFPGKSVHGISQARILEWTAIPFSSESSWPRDRTQVSCNAGRFFTVWAIGKTLKQPYSQVKRNQVINGERGYWSLQYTSGSNISPPLIILLHLPRMPVFSPMLRKLLVTLQNPVCEAFLTAPKDKSVALSLELSLCWPFL